LAKNEILLGFEVGTAKPVYVSLHHLAIFGMTQKSGKTTTLEALSSRGDLRAIAFLTKRGESGFHKVNLLTPYYKPKADWQFVEGLVNVALGEKVKYEPAMRWAIMKVSEGSRNLHEVMNKAKQLKKESKRSFIKQTFEKLVNYLKIVVPELEKWTFTDKLVLEEGINVMDLTGMRLETQQIVIASTIEYVFDNMENTVVVIPEAWETLPQSKMTPVKWVAQRFIRKGASIGNYLWIDSQDIGGIDKTPLRQCDNWLMGRMKEYHEVERIIKQLLGQKVPLKEIQTLPLGHFFAVIGDHVSKVYVLPKGVPEDTGRKVALGELSPEYVRDNILVQKVKEGDEEMYKQKCRELEKINKALDWKISVRDDEIKKLKAEIKDPQALQGTIFKLKEELEALQRKHKWVNKAVADLTRKNEELTKIATHHKRCTKTIEDLTGVIDRAEKDLKIYDEFRSALGRMLEGSIPTMPGIPVDATVDATVEHKELVATIKHVGQVNVTLTTDNQEGQVMYVLLNDFLPGQTREANAQGVTEAMISAELKEHGWIISHASLAPRLGGLVKKGLLLRVAKTRPQRYRLPLKVTVKVEK